jgi:hypothetical protein
MGLTHRLKEIAGGAPVVVWTASMLLTAELVAAGILPEVLPDARYLSWYLLEGAEDATDEFLDGDHLLEPDPATGWRMRPSVSRERWTTDSLGARPSGRTAPDWGEPGVTELVAVGSSMVNGGTAIANDQTLTAYLESDSLTALNFGTMLFGLDQSYLLYTSRLRALRPDVVLVGIDEDCYGPIENVYVPLRRRSELNMPFVKPRFRLEGDGLETIEADPRALLSDLTENDVLVRFFSRWDGYAYRFAAFRRFGLTPVLGLASSFADRVRSRLAREDKDLLLALMGAFRDAVEGDGARIVFLAMPPRRAGGVALPGEGDPWSERLATWKDAGFPVIDGREVFRASGAPQSSLYGRDGIHLSARGNATLAAAVAQALAPY